MGIKPMIKLYRLLLSKPEVAQKYRKLRRHIVLAISLLLLSELLSVAEPFPLRGLFDGMLANEPATSLLVFVAGMIGLRLAHTLVTEVAEYFQISSVWHNLVYILGAGHEHQINLDPAYQIEHGTGEKESVLSKAIWKVDRLIDTVAYHFVPMCMMISFIVTGLLLINWHYTVLSVATITIYCVVTRHFEKRFAKVRRASHEQWKASEKEGSQQIKDWETIKNEGLEQPRSGSYQVMIDGFADQEDGRRKARIWHWIVQNNVLNLSLLCMWLITLKAYSDGSVTIGDIALLNAWMAKLYAHMYRYADFQREAQEGIEGLNDLIELFETKSEIDASPGIQLDQSEVRGEICIDGVGFTYPGCTDPALVEISAKIIAGSFVAIVGPSGGGKSTLAKMLCRAFDPTIGRVTLDGVDLRDLDRKHMLQTFMSVVLQDTHLRDGSIKDNICYGVRSYSQTEVEQAARKAHIHDEIMKMPQGYETEVGEDGIKLSGGQQQRIAIARALIKDPIVLIMDEPTSSLDEMSQKVVKHYIADLSDGNCTRVVIAHRWSTIEDADMVIVVENGHMIDCGTHAELEARCELYRQLKSGEVVG